MSTKPWSPDFAPDQRLIDVDATVARERREDSLMSWIIGLVCVLFIIFGMGIVGGIESNAPVVVHQQGRR